MDKMPDYYSRTVDFPNFTHKKMTNGHFCGHVLDMSKSDVQVHILKNLRLLFQQQHALNKIVNQMILQGISTNFTPSFVFCHIYHKMEKFHLHNFAYFNMNNE